MAASKSTIARCGKKSLLHCVLVKNFAQRPFLGIEKLEAACCPINGAVVDSMGANVSHKFSLPAFIKRPNKNSPTFYTLLRDG